jgi:hypothetical protein
VRMAFEAIFVFARATGRTIVMPPDEAFYFPDRESLHIYTSPLTQIVILFN